MILALDTGTNTGVAYGRPGDVPKAFTVRLGKAGWDDRFAKTLRMVEVLIDRHKPDRVVIEAPAAGDFKSADLVGLTVCARAQAARMGVPTQLVYANTVRKHFLGKALTARDFPGMSRERAKGQIKARVIAKCRMLGWPITEPDAADAAALWDYVCATESPNHHTVGGLFAVPHE